MRERQRETRRDRKRQKETERDPPVCENCSGSGTFVSGSWNETFKTFAVEKMQKMAKIGKICFNKIFFKAIR
jgi:hypothetical protein